MIPVVALAAIPVVAPAATLAWPVAKLVSYRVALILVVVLVVALVATLAWPVAKLVSCRAVLILAAVLAAALVAILAAIPVAAVAVRSGKQFIKLVQVGEPPVAALAVVPAAAHAKVHVKTHAV